VRHEVDDRDCNPVGAVFSTDEIEPNTCCGTCHREIK